MKPWCRVSSPSRLGWVESSHTLTLLQPIQIPHISYRYLQCCKPSLLCIAFLETKSLWWVGWVFMFNAHQQRYHERTWQTWFLCAALCKVRYTSSCASVLTPVDADSCQNRHSLANSHLHHRIGYYKPRKALKKAATSIIIQASEVSNRPVQNRYCCMEKTQ